MGGTLATGTSIYMASAGVPAADGAGLSSIKSFSQLLTDIAALPLTGGTLTGNLLFSADNTYTIGATGATRPSAVHVGTGGVISAGVGTFSGVLTPSGGVTFPVSTWFTSSDTTQRLYFVNGSWTTYKSAGSASFTHIFQDGDGISRVLFGNVDGVSSYQHGFTAYDASNTKDVRLKHNGTHGVLSTSSGALVLTGATSVSSTVPISSGVYTFATVPTASSYSGAAIRISDRSQKWAYSDGTEWRFFVDGAVIS